MSKGKNAKGIDKILQSAVEHVFPHLMDPEAIKLRGKARADARAYKIRQIAQAKKDAKDIQSGRAQLSESGGLIRKSLSAESERTAALPNDPRAALSPMQLARAAADRQALRQYGNLAEAVSMALDEAESIPDERVSDDPVDPDWFAAWREGAQRVSNEEMRVFWARILAGETKQPDSYSLHTIEVLRRLSRADAKLIEEVAPLVVSNEIPALAGC